MGNELEFASGAAAETDADLPFGLQIEITIEDRDVVAELCKYADGEERERAIGHLQLTGEEAADSAAFFACGGKMKARRITGYNYVKHLVVNWSCADHTTFFVSARYECAGQ